MARKKKITLQQKINLGSIVRRLHADPSRSSPSLKALARARGIDPNQLRRWER
jgi:transposase-like protein